MVLKRLMEGREGEVPLGGSEDVAARWACAGSWSRWRFRLLRLPCPPTCASLLLLA